MMWDAPPKLTNEDIEDLQATFETFYREYADVATPSIVGFIDSVYEQFQSRKFLSEKQIIAVNNIIDNFEDPEYQQY